jgi:hypothetical protein
MYKLADAALNRCGRKKCYTPQRAAEVAAAMTRRTGEWLISYECFDCGHSHIGHAQKDQQIILQPTLKRRKKSEHVKRDAAEATNARVSRHVCDVCGELFPSMKKFKIHGRQGCHPTISDTRH